MNKSGKTKLWLISGTALLIGSLVLYRLFWRANPGERTYHEASVEKGAFTEMILSTGTVAPENRLAIRPPIGGRIEKILVREGQTVTQGAVLAWVSTTERAALLDSARAEGEAELAQWEQYYRPTPVYAPIRGMIILRNLEPGQSFNAGDTLLVMSNRLTVKAQVDETSISKVSVGQHAEVVLDAYPNEVLEAKVVHRGFDSKTVNNVTSYVVDVLPNRVPSHMLSGMTATVRFVLQELPEALQVPNEALQSENGTACLRKKISGPERCHPVKTGPSGEKKTVILSGVDPGEVLLVPDLKPIDSNRKSMPANPFSPMGGRRH
jgi:macrolide-specific efflux system membrane fusion protein